MRKFAGAYQAGRKSWPFVSWRFSSLLRDGDGQEVRQLLGRDGQTLWSMFQRAPQQSGGISLAARALDVEQSTQSKHRDDSATKLVWLGASSARPAEIGLF